MDVLKSEGVDMGGETLGVTNISNRKMPTSEDEEVGEGEAEEEEGEGGMR